MSVAGLLGASATRASPGVPRRAWVPIAVTAGVMGIALAALLQLRAVDWGRLAVAFRALGAAPLLVGIAGGFGVVALQSLRWWVVTRPVLRVRYGEAYGAMLVGGALNAILPARAGDLLRVQYLAERARVSRATLYGTELVDFWTDKSGWLPAFAVLALTGAPPSWMYRALAVMAAIAAALFAGVLVLRRRLRGVPATDGWKGRFAAGLAASSPTRLAVTALLLAALPWVWEAIAIQRVAAVAGISLMPLHAFVLLTAFNLAMVVPVPGGLGVHEAASTAVLVSLGVPLERAIAFALVYHASQLVPYALGGALALRGWRRRPASVVPAPVANAPQVELADSAADWDAYVSQRPDATLYHRFAWKTVAETAYGMRAPFLVARDGPGQPIRGVLPLVRVPRPFAPYLTSGLFGSYGPLLADEDRHARALLAEAAHRVDEGDAAFLHLKLLGDAPVDPGMQRHDVWVTAQLDLGRDADEAWKRLRSPMRNKIRHAQRAGLLAERGPGGLDAFYDVLSENMARKGAPIYGLKFMRVMLEELGPCADVLLLRHEGRVVSGALVAWFNGTMVVPFASSRPSAFHLRPNYLLYWEIARRALDLGLHTLDFGSSLRDSTGLEFKESWKPRIEPIGSYVYAGGRTPPPLAPADSALARNAVRIWSHLPAPLAQRLGPVVCRWIA